MPKKQKQTISFVLASDAVYNSFDIVGDIAIIKLPEYSTVDASHIAATIMNRHKKIKTVLLQSSPVSGDYRTRKLSYVFGENRTITTHKESGCIFRVDLESCYYSPRLSYEHMRIAQLIKPNEKIVNMFAGIGCFSIIIAKKVSTAKIYSIDINPCAFEYMKKNISLNKVTTCVIPLLGDSKEIIESHFQGFADRVLMPLPEKAFEYLPCAISALKPKEGGWIHIHSFERASTTKDAIAKVKRKITEVLFTQNVLYNISFLRQVRRIGPSKYQIEADIYIKKI
ncbi:MAG: class I SAM-dependent methyltransferase family protein [Crenarchaeota archaeon]|nr:class I SAM-dependent methyltransferase family protein [Thermoproteota archaeon]